MARNEWLQTRGWKYFLGACLAVALAILVFAGPKAHKAKAPQAIPTGSISGAASPSATPKTTTPSSHPYLKVDDALVTRLQTFVEAFYFIKPDDTAASRQSRMPAFVKTKLDLQIVMDIRQDKARLTPGKTLTIRGVLLPSSVDAVADPQDPRKLNVSAQAMVSLYYTATGVPYSDQSATEGIATVWQKNASGQWELIRFVEGGDTG